MDDRIEVSIPVEPEVAKTLEDPARREAAGRYLRGMRRGGRAHPIIAEAIAKRRQRWRWHLFTSPVDEGPP
jgi:hypothetical protein